MGGGVHVIHEVKLLATMAHPGNLDAAIQKLIDMVIQRYLFGSI
jgi:hypothetical protein